MDRVVNSASETPGGTNASPESPPPGFRCGECGRPLVSRRLPPVGRMTEPDVVWETPPQIPPGSTDRSDVTGWICSGGDCRRAYLVCEGVPNFLRQEAGVLTAAAHSGVVAIPAGG
jgi:uncharacterized protein YbaR (Trm112 family)